MSGSTKPLPMAQPHSCPHLDASFAHGVSPTHAAGGRRCPFSGVQSTAAATAFAATSDAIVSTDAAGRILASNNGAEVMFGLSSDELIRCHVHDILTSCAQASPKRSEHPLFGFLPGSKNRTVRVFVRVMTMFCGAVLIDEWRRP